MMNSYHKITALILCVGVLHGCDKARDAFGLSRHQPDEFTTPPRSNLQAPSTLVLTPPQQGAPRLGTVIADHQAQQILRVQSSADSSKELSLIEKNFLDDVQTTTADPKIRQKISQETRGVQQPKPLINELLFWQQPQDRHDKVIDPHKERDETKKLINQKKQRDSGNDED